VSAGISVDELDKVVLGAGALVREWLRGALLEVFDGGVGLDALGFGGGLGVVSLGIDLGDQDAGLGGVVVGEGFPSGSEALAVCSFPLALPNSQRIVKWTYGRTMAQ
jgi:hypothetical protein